MATKAAPARSRRPYPHPHPPPGGSSSQAMATKAARFQPPHPCPPPGGSALQAMATKAARSQPLHSHPRPPPGGSSPQAMATKAERSQPPHSHPRPPPGGSSPQAMATKAERSQSPHPRPSPGGSAPHATATKAARSRPFLVIPDIVSNYDLLRDPGSLGLEVVECKRSAVGCGPTGVRVLEGISLYLVRGGEDDDPVRYPRMCIRVSDEAFDLVSAEIDDRKANIWGRNLRTGCRVFSMQGDVMVISLVFIADHDPRPFRAYYLVYDSATASLFMIPYLPRHCSTITTCPIPVRCQDDARYSLVLLAYRSNLMGDNEADALCLWSLPPLPHNMKLPALPLPLNDIDPWVAKSRRRANSDCLNVHLVFSSKDYAFWVDLTRGILYCSISDLLNGGGEPVDFKYIPLPEECSISTDIRDAVHVHRNMGLGGDSTIWFVAIEPEDNTAKYTKVVVWTLDLTELMSKKKTKKKKWQKLREFKMQSIWELDAFRKKGLPRTEPRFPIWRQQRGGVLYMLLPNLNSRHGHLVGIHVGCGTIKMRLLSCRSLTVPWISHPVVLPLDFFTLGDTVV